MIVLENSIKIIIGLTPGSGSLLLQMKKQFEEHIIEGGFFGQEINMTNFKLAHCFIEKRFPFYGILPV